MVMEATATIRIPPMPRAIRTSISVMPRSRRFDRSIDIGLQSVLGHQRAEAARPLKIPRRPPDCEVDPLDILPVVFNRQPGIGDRDGPEIGHALRRNEDLLVALHCSDRGPWRVSGLERGG